MISFNLIKNMHMLPCLTKVGGRDFPVGLFRRLFSYPTRAVGLGRFFFMAVFFLIFSGQLSHGAPIDPAAMLEKSLAGPLVPDKLIIPDPPVLSWMLSWGESRRLVREGKLKGAIFQYEKLLGEKGDLEEARWELTRIRLRLRQWQAAVVLLEVLVEHHPAEAKYISALAYVAWITGQPDRAAHLFGKLLELIPDNRDTLEGGIKCYLLAGQPERALSFLEILHRLDPSDLLIRSRLAKLYDQVGLVEQARQHFVELAKDPKVDIEVLRLTARIHDRLALENLAAEYWQKILERGPDNAEARKKLAAFNDNNGRYDEALSLLLPLLSRTGEDYPLMKIVGRLYVKTGQEEQALVLLEKYAARRPRDKEVVRDLINIHARLGDREKIIGAIERYFSLEAAAPAPGLKEAARDYDASGHFRDAVPLYRRLLTIAPDDPGILATLANDLLNIGESDGTRNMRKHLKLLGPKRVELYRSMSELLAGLGRDEELVEILETIHELEPTDAAITLKLANIYLARNDLSRSLYFFEWLYISGYREVPFYEGRGRLFEKANKPSLALVDFEMLLQLAPERNDIRFNCIRLAGRLGLLPTLRNHLKKIEAYTGGRGKVEDLLVVAAALRECGAFAAARGYYRQLLSRVAADKELTCRVLLAQATTLAEAELVFEAGQALRQAYVLCPDSDEVLNRLFEYALAREGLPDEASWWLAMLMEHWVSRPKNSFGTVGSPAGEDRAAGLLSRDEWEISLKRARVLGARGELRKAIGRARRLTVEIERQPALLEIPEVRETWRRVGLSLAGFLLENGDPDEAQQVCLEVLRESRATSVENQQVLVLLLKSYKRQAMWRPARDVFTRILNSARHDLGRMLETADFFQEYGLTDELLYLAREARQSEPQSVRAGFLLVEALSVSGKKPEAAEVLYSVVTVHPDNERAAVMQAGLFYKRGLYDKAIARCDLLLAGQQVLPNVLLVKARSLWALQRWKDSLAVYGAFLTPAASQLFTEELDKQGMKIELPERESSFKEVIFLSRPTSPDPLAWTLDPSRLIEFRGEDDPWHRTAVDYFSLYKWQARFKAELAARRAVQRREYFQAMHRLRGLVRDFPEEESLLFDLAGIYSRLGRLQDEALLYARLAELDAGYPGLDKARERNQLKRLPRGSAGFVYQRDEGYFGYKDIKKQWWETSVWSSPKPQSELEIVFAKPGYRSTDFDLSIESRRVEVNYRAHFLGGLSATMGTGFEDLEDGYASTGLLRGSLDGMLGDAISGWVSFERDTVTDTTASITRNIVAHAIDSGLALDLSPRLKLGGDYGVTNYSDNNYMQGYDLWGSYLLFQEPYYLTFSYSYFFKDSKEGASPGSLLPDGFGADDHPYWAPKNYWKNRFALFFKHQLSKDTLGRGTPRYYTVEYCLDYDSYGYGGQSIEGTVYLEWTPNFIVESALSYSSSQIVRSRGFSLAAVYRW